MNGIHRHIYGPVLSRRLGCSLGIDLVPFKTCSYDCIYCQLGRTLTKTIERRDYCPQQEILDELKDKLSRGIRPKYISLAGSGEPTLCTGIGSLIEKIKSITDIPVAVLTNGSLLFLPEVREELGTADLILPSLDAGDDFLFQYVNRPHRDISFDSMTEGLVEFTNSYGGQVWLEVVLLNGVTAIERDATNIAKLTDRMRIDKIQLNTATRPPAKEFAHAAPSALLQRLAGIFSPRAEVISDRRIQVPSVDEVIGPASEDEILLLLRRRPCTAADVAEGLGIHVSEALKNLQRFVERGRVTTQKRTDGVYFEPSRIDK